MKHIEEKNGEGNHLTRVLWSTQCTNDMPRGRRKNREKKRIGRRNRNNQEERENKREKKEPCTSRSGHYREEKVYQVVSGPSLARYESGMAMGIQ